MRCSTPVGATSCWPAAGRSWPTTRRNSGKPYHTVLRYRVAHPDLRSPELADGLEQGARQADQRRRGASAAAPRARAFAELLLDEVTESLDERIARRSGAGAYRLGLAGILPAGAGKAAREREVNIGGQGTEKGKSVEQEATEKTERKDSTLTSFPLLPPVQISPGESFSCDESIWLRIRHRSWRTIARHRT